MPVAHRPAVVALDVGGTAVKSLVVDAHGVLDHTTTPTGAGDGPERCLDTVLRTVDATLDRVPATHTAVAVGIAVPGTVDEHRGVCVVSENLGWRGVPVRELVAHRTGLPVGFGHDVRAGGLAEWRLGAGRGIAGQAYLSIGTGLAAALVLEGRMVVVDGYAGEIGHGGATGGERCACGGRGCPETVASAAAIARRYTALTGVDVRGARDVVRRAGNGDADARRVWEDALNVLAGVVTDLVRVSGVGHVVVGGGLVHAGDTLLTPLRDRVRDGLTVHRVPRIVPAVLGGAAGAWGAALLGWQATGQAGDDVVARYEAALELPEQRCEVRTG